MDHFLPNKNIQSPPFVMDGSDQSIPALSACTSTSTSSNSSWSMQENDPQLYPTDVSSFWQDMTPYLNSTPTSPYKYPYDETPGGGGGGGGGAPNDDDFYAAPERGGGRRVRNKEASPEVILRRRAQNRASQRAYRDRKDRRVKELETELAALTSAHEKLERDHGTLCTSHASLVAAEKAWIKEKREMLKSGGGGCGGGEEDGGGVKGGRGKGDVVDGVVGRAEEGGSWSCEGEVKRPGTTTEMGRDGSFVVKVVLCKRCYGEDARVGSMSCSRTGA